MITVYFYFEHNPDNVRGHWVMETPPAVGDEVELWKPAESESTCVVTRRKWVPIDTGSETLPPFAQILDVYVKVIDRSDVGKRDYNIRLKKQS